jgi:uncharacterized protein (DUF433 family)
MATSKAATFPRIVRVPGVVGGEPVIKGTRVSVAAIVQYYRMYHDVGRVREAMPHLSTVAIKEALAFYEAHREEIDRFIALDEAEDEGDGAD